MEAYLCSLASDRSLCDLSSTSQQVLARDSIDNRRCLDTNDTNPRIVRTSIMLAVTQVSQPCLEGRAVVLLDQLAIRLDGGLSGDGSPLAGAVQERNVDVGIGIWSERVKSVMRSI